MESEFSAFKKEKAALAYKINDITKLISKTEIIVNNISEDYAKYPKINFSDSKDIPIKISWVDNNQDNLGKYILALKDQDTKGIEKTFGQLYGFDLCYRTEKTFSDGGLEFHSCKYFVKGKYLYTHNNGYINSDKAETVCSYFIHAMEKIPKLLTNKENELINLKTDKVELEKLYTQPWNKEKLLSECKSNLKVIENRITASIQISDRDSKDENIIVSEPKGIYQSSNSEPKNNTNYGLGM